MKLQDLRIKWTSGASCPYDTVDAVFHLKLKDNKIYFSNGNCEVEIKKDALVNIFTPINCEWKDVDFNEAKRLKK